MPDYPSIISPLEDYRISSPFGNRSSPGGIGSTNHRGLDMAAPTGTPIVAPTDMKIVYAGTASGYGNYVKGQDAAGNTYDFGHLNTIGVSSGTVIPQGTQIGTVGSTGNSTGPHLHFGIKDKAGKYLDPKVLLDQAENLGNKAIDSAKEYMKDTLIAVGLSNPVTAPFVVGAEVAGLLDGDGEECGSLDFVCKLRKWFKETDFFARFGLIIVAILLILGSLLLLARAQTGRVLSTITKGS